MRFVLVAAMFFAGLCLPRQAAAYSVLAHEANIDALWDPTIKTLLQARFLGATPEQLVEARAYAVHALIAHTNHGGAVRLRKLEQRLLAAGATVDRTGDDFIRYHGKFMIVDRSTLLILGFNYTLVDITKSRSFGIVTKNRKIMQDAVALFEADCARQPYVAQGALAVSPVNARDQLSAFLGKAKTPLLIYDPKISDPRMLRLLKERAKAGVDVRIIGRVSSRGEDLVHQKYPGHRLHVRAIIRDGRDAFIGSQSLRKLELDQQREVGVFLKNASIVNELRATFDADWAQTAAGIAAANAAAPAASRGVSPLSRTAHATVDLRRNVVPENTSTEELHAYPGRHRHRAHRRRDWRADGYRSSREEQPWISKS
jgi:phosphatidylserine/phosphatidylglycerophosphate/cardiolipin synthase-like enzyme